MKDQAMTQQQHSPSHAGTRRAFWTKGPGLIVAIVAAGLVGFGIYLMVNWPGSAADQAQVSVRGCQVGGAGSMQTAKVDLTLRNTGDSSEYFVATVEYRDSAGNRLDAGEVKFPLAAPGDTVVASGSAFLDASVQSGTCVVTGVSD